MREINWILQINAEFTKTVHTGIVRNMNTYPAFFTNTTRQVYSKATGTILNYVDAPSFKKFYRGIASYMLQTVTMFTQY